MFEKNQWIKFNDISLVSKKKKILLKFLNYLLIVHINGVEKLLKVLIALHLIQIYYKYNNKFFPRDTIDQIKQKKNLK